MEFLALFFHGLAGPLRHQVCASNELVSAMALNQFSNARMRFKLVKAIQFHKTTAAVVVYKVTLLF